jgi:hypothetical protein
MESALESQALTGALVWSVALKTTTHVSVARTGRLRTLRPAIAQARAAGPFAGPVDADTPGHRGSDGDRRAAHLEPDAVDDRDGLLITAKAGVQE